MKLAFAHDYLLRFGGAERVLKELHVMYPEVPIFTLFCDPKVRAAHFPDADILTAWVDRVPFPRRLHRLSLPLLPLAVESLDFHEYDVVLSSSSAFIKGIVTRSHAKHICYCHTPPRFLWEDREAYSRHHIPFLMRPLRSPMLHVLRLWDQHAAQRVDQFLANSAYTAGRIQRYYQSPARVVFPPVDTSVHPCSDETRKRFSLPDEFFLFVGRLVWWKHPQLAVETFNRLGPPLLVVGSGPLVKKLRGAARKNIHILGWQSDQTVRELMHAATALIHPHIEDFGMTAVEAMAEGTPVVAFRRGGVVETVVESVSGEFFDDPDPIALADAVRRLREGGASGKYDRERIRTSAQRYARERFHEAIRQEIEVASAQK